MCYTVFNKLGKRPTICNVLFVGHPQGGATMTKSIKEVIMDRDGLTSFGADDLIADATKDLHERLAEGEMPYDICEEWFGLEPDYIMELI